MNNPTRLSITLCLWLAGCGGAPAPCADPAACLQSPAAGHALAQAVRSHAPTPEELKQAAAVWAIAISALQSGAFDARSLPSAGWDRLLPNVRGEYPSLFGTTGSAAQALIRGPQDFRCDNDCIPHPQLLTATIGALYGKLLETLGKSNEIREAAQKLASTIADSFAGASKAPQTLGEASQAISEQDAVSFLAKIGEVLAGAGAVAEAAALLGVSAPALEVIAAAGAVGSAVVIGVELAKAARLMWDCMAWKAQACVLRGTAVERWVDHIPTGTLTFNTTFDITLDYDGGSGLHGFVDATLQGSEQITESNGCVFNATAGPTKYHLAAQAQLLSTGDRATQLVTPLGLMPSTVPVTWQSMSQCPAGGAASTQQLTAGWAFDQCPLVNGRCDRVRDYTSVGGDVHLETHLQFGAR